MSLYTERRVRKLVIRLKEEYDKALRQQKEAAAKLVEENRVLKARLIKLEEERTGVADALILAAREQERVKASHQTEEENEGREIRLLAEKCRLLADDLQKKYPDAEDVQAFAAYTDELRSALGEEVETGFNMDDVLAPKEPLDLGKLCRSLGLMEEDA